MFSTDAKQQEKQNHKERRKNEEFVEED